MTPLGDILRQLHLAIEGVVLAENQASDEYARELRADVIHTYLRRAREMIEERQ